MFTIRYLLLYSLIFITYTGYSRISIDVSTLGAQGDNSTDNTLFIQQAIDSVSNSGGGEVIITNGTYLSSTIILKSDVTLRVTTGTTLKALPNYSSFPDIPYNVRSWSDTYTDRSLIFAEDANNIRITGGGTIDGNGTSTGYLSISVKSRPFGMRLHGIDTLQIDSIHLRQAPQWFGHIDSCLNVHIFNISVYNQCFGSNDGIDIDGCLNVLVENSTFDTNDDCLPIKTHGYNICRDVMVRNCTMATFERAVKVGNETLGPLVNIHFQDITVIPSSNTILALAEVPYNAMYIAVADGGSMDSIYFERINVQAKSQASIFIRLCDRGNNYNPFHPTVKYLRNVWLNDISATQTSTIPNSITGIPGYPVQNINFHNVVLTVPGGGAPGSDSIGEQLGTRPEFNIWGDTLPAYGLFVRHADDLNLDSFCVILKSYDQRAEFYETDTANMTLISPCSSPDVNDIKSIGAPSGISFYPNPASDRLYIQGISSDCETVLFYDMRGAIVAIIPSMGRTQMPICISAFESGIYTAVAMGQNYRQVKKVVITR
jgi:hypothetical protein